ncbi:MAG: hypothetical protein FJ151_02715 [Euryarchaeota archaeon]|nr:hypothetical protein [Euryarchaeota archaeon]
MDVSARYCPKCGTHVQTYAPPPVQQYQPAPPVQAGYAGTPYRRESRPDAAIVLSIVAGVLILINGLLVAIGGPFLLFFLEPIGIPLVILGLVFGLAVLIGAIKLSQNPRDHITWGAIILIFSLLSIVIGGGFVLGLILGLIGGILALVWNE